MNSPDKELVAYINLNKESNTPIYIQLVEQIIKGIQLGYLIHETKLPGTRQLSEILKLNRNTIVKAFEELQAQEWIKIIPNKGTFIYAKDCKSRLSSKNTAHFTEKAPFMFEQSILFDLPITPTAHAIILDDGLIDTQLIEYKIPAKNYAGLLKRQINPKLSKQAFEKQLLNYIKLSRNINCKAENLLIANNQEIILHLICKLFQSNIQLKVAIPQLNHYKSNIIFQSNHALLYQIKMNNGEIDLGHLENIALTKQFDVLYLPSNFQYPTTTTLNYNQKIEIGILSKKHNFVVLEHDPTSDYYYTPNTILPFVSTNYDNKSLYISGFGDFLSHNYNFGFLIAPADFITEAKKHLFLLENTRDQIALQAIGEMIKEGEIVRLLKRHRKIYKEKRDYLCNLLIQTLGSKIWIELPKGGLAIWIEWKVPINLMFLKKSLDEDGIYLPQHCLYQAKNQQAIRLGFASLTFKQIDEVVAAFKKIHSALD